MSQDNANDTQPVTQAQHREVLDAIRAGQQMHHTIIEKLSAMEERLRRHYDEDHKEFNTILDWARGGRIAAKILALLVGLVAGCAAAYAWISGHFTITPRQ